MPDDHEQSALNGTSNASSGTTDGEAAAAAWKMGTWLNRPRTFAIEGSSLYVVTDAKTDFWRTTFYGFERDSGHFLGFDAGDRFTAQVRVKARYAELYDQAGIMVRIDERRWLKAGIELADGRAMLSSVLTDGASDWATAPYGGDAADFWLRVTVDAGVLRLQVSNDGQVWPLMRLSPFPRAERYLVGPMTCTPEREGLEARFSEWSLTAPLSKDLHDLS